MTIDQYATPDQRGGFVRALVAVGIALCGAIGLAMTVTGAVLLDRPAGQAVLCLGLVLLVAAAAGIAREMAERRHDRLPPQPRLVILDGEPALFLPRSPDRSRVSSAAVLGLAAVSALGAVFCLAAGELVGGAALLVVGGALGWSGRPSGAGAGGLWFGPRRLVHEHDGVRWELPWSDVSGSVPGEPLAVTTYAGRAPRVSRSARRFRGRSSDGSVLFVETRFLAGGSVLASYIIGKAILDPGFRADLGTDASLPTR